MSESEASVGSHDNVANSLQGSAAVVVGEGVVETGEGLEHLAAHFNSQQGQQVNNNVREEVRDGIVESLNDSAGRRELFVDHVAAAPRVGSSLAARLEQAEASTAMNRARFEGDWRRFDVALPQIGAALNHADEVAQFLRANTVPVHHVQEEIQPPQVGRRERDGSDHSSDSNETLLGPEPERASLGSSEGTVDLLHRIVEEPHVQAEVPNNVQAAPPYDHGLVHFSESIVGELSSHGRLLNFHINNAIRAF